MGKRTKKVKKAEGVTSDEINRIVKTVSAMALVFIVFKMAIVIALESNGIFYFH